MCLSRRFTFGLTAVMTADAAVPMLWALLIIEGRNVYNDLHALSTLSYKLFFIFLAVGGGRGV
jgi:hypothetical protein